MPEKCPYLHSDLKHGEGVGHSIVRDADDLAGVIDGNSDAFAATCEHTEADNFSTLPQNSDALRSSRYRINDSGLRRAEAPSPVVD